MRSRIGPSISCPLKLERLFDLSDIILTVDSSLDLDSLSPVSQSTLSMVLRELANNVIKHSQADSCQIRLSRKHGIVLEFEDNGCGFKEVTGQELHSIRERLSLVDGDLEIMSQSHPTIIRVHLKEGGKA